MVVFFLPAITNDRDGVHTLLFGTRLTNITRHLRRRDVDVAVARVASAVSDWSGGTRIGACLAEFNRRWSRRPFCQGPVVLSVRHSQINDLGVELSLTQALASKTI